MYFLGNCPTENQHYSGFPLLGRMSTKESHWESARYCARRHMAVCFSVNIRVRVYLCYYLAGGWVGREGWVPGVLVFAVYDVYEKEDLVTHLSRSYSIY